MTSSAIMIVILLGVAASNVIVIALLYRRRPAAPVTAPAQPDMQALPVSSIQGAQQQLEGELKRAYEAQITAASQLFAQDLQATSTVLNNQVTKLAEGVIKTELSAYQQTLQEVRDAATQTMAQIHETLEAQRVELRQGMEDELAAERARLVAQFDTRMADVIGSYVTESLGADVDLGAQLGAITKSLEANRDAIKQDLISGA